MRVLTIQTMDAPTRPTSETDAGSRDDLYRLWLEWVTVNLGRDSHSASLAAKAATEAAVRGSDFDDAVEAAREAWLSARASQGRHSLDWSGAIGRLLIFGSVLALVAIAAVFATGLFAFGGGGGGPIVVCPDMCGLGQGVTYPTALTADVSRWTPGGGELAGTLTSSAGLTCQTPMVQVGFFDSTGAAIGVVQMDLAVALPGGETLSWDEKFWPPPSASTSIAYTLGDGTRITEEGGLTGPVPAATVATRVVNTTCLVFLGEQP